MTEALQLLVVVLAVGNIIYDKFTIRELRRESSYLLASLLEVSNEKRAAATVREGEPAPARPAPDHPMQRPQQIGLGRRP